MFALTSKKHKKVCSSTAGNISAKKNFPATAKSQKALHITRRARGPELFDAAKAPDLEGPGDNNRRRRKEPIGRMEHSIEEPDTARIQGVGSRSSLFMPVMVGVFMVGFV